MIVCSGRSTTCTIQRQQSITQRLKIPVKALIHPNRVQTGHGFAHLFDSERPSRSPHACSNEHQHQPQRIHRQNRLRPLLNFPTINPTASLTIGTLDAMKVDDGFPMGEVVPCSTLTHSRRWSCILPVPSLRQLRK